jgi:hypothetical protein
MSGEPSWAILASQVDAARAALSTAAKSDPSRWWTASELRHEIQNGWMPGAVMLALNRLVSDGAFEVDSRLRVRAHT